MIVIRIETSKSIKNKYIYIYIYISGFHSEHDTCMELIKQISRDISETELFLRAMKIC